MGFALFIIAYILFLPLSIINFLVVKNKKGYFRSSAITIDKLANREFRTLWNKTLIKPNAFQFGAENETISAVIGLNKKTNTLTRIGMLLYKILNKIEKNHCEMAANLRN
jgi:ABC-type glucose/galactose transport system permease subunit